MRRSFLTVAVLGLASMFLMAEDAQACHRNRGCQQPTCAPVHCPPPCPPPVYCPPPAPPCPPPVYCPPPCQPVAYCAPAHCAPAPKHCGLRSKLGGLRGKMGGHRGGCR
ncbi:MAG: hypothetical protein ABI353_23920 [Isosphaeraceae bacterium]